MIRANSIEMKGTTENRKVFSKESNQPPSKSGLSLALKSGGNFQVDTSNTTITAKEFGIQPLLKSAADYLSPPENPQPRRPLEPILKLSQNILVQQSSRIEQLQLPTSITRDMKSEIASLNASMSDLDDRISALEEFASEIPCDKHQVFDLFRWSRTVDYRFNAIERANDDTNCELADLKEEDLNIHLQLRSLRCGGKTTRLEKAGVIDDALAEMKSEIKEELRKEFREELIEELKRDFKPCRKSSRITPAKPFRKMAKSTPPALASV
ncbi:hypothetical protein BS50DRAFT_199643 [Corynespora cassiicola Philippines]|uniref:Uncharacterized protein n=1 Tax=Corynespora cassiicola Philippines TaxID=1448308 RepID=A0A2T2N5Y1_CORCC|nr:hypothetical protein BS50DRAFT_199643 [Corynespora cassiicola Philippines]